MRLLISILLFGLLTILYQPEIKSQNTEALEVNKKSQKAPELLSIVEDRDIKNVILLIGDGTGLAQIASGMIAIVGPDGLLHMQTMPVTGFVKTHSSDKLITDSASGATAFACGLKTYNGAIAVNPEKVHCKTLLELAEEKGLSTGLISTSSITHATPASFAAHVDNRGLQEQIAHHFLNAGVEVFLGGGYNFFDSSTRSDSLDLISEFEKEGYDILRTNEDLENTDSDQLLGLFAPDGMERADSEPTSEEMVNKTLNILSKDKDGFFLMLEGSQIDWAGHGNDVEYLIDEVKDFDAAVKAVLDFAEQDGETLVILTADHETGGMTLQRELAAGDSLEIYWTTDYHTAIPVPMMAYGPHATEFMGWRDNTYIGKKIAELLDFPELPILIE
ncbi:MAG: alkaline phosphatase [Gracilimonas sp.]|nr:alkaline phosphatase [Gracilimonas sp.]